MQTKWSRAERSNVTRSANFCSEAPRGQSEARAVAALANERITWPTAYQIKEDERAARITT